MTFSKNKTPWNKGIKRTEEEKLRISFGTKKAMSNPLVKLHLRNKKLGTHLKEETKRKLSLLNRGKNNHYYGKKHSPEILKKIANRPYPTKEKHPWWKGGISNEPYSFDFNSELKLLIKKRDNFRCQICFAPVDVIHHINYVKTCSNPDNLISLCNKCHGKTNQNRSEWLYYFRGAI